MPIFVECTIVQSPKDTIEIRVDRDTQDVRLQLPIPMALELFDELGSVLSEVRSITPSSSSHVYNISKMH